MVLLIFIFFLAIATLDLAYVLSLCFFFGKVFGVTNSSFTGERSYGFSGGQSAASLPFFHKS